MYAMPCIGPVCQAVVEVRPLIDEASALEHCPQGRGVMIVVRNCQTKECSKSQSRDSLLISFRPLALSGEELVLVYCLCLLICVLVSTCICVLFLCVFMCLISMWLFMCLLSMCVFMCLISICLFMCLISMCVFMCLLSMCLFMCLISMCLFMCLGFNLYMYLISICLFTLCVLFTCVCYVSI